MSRVSVTCPGCGAARTVTASNKSQIEKVQRRKCRRCAPTTHGLTDTPTHRSWVHMRRRCESPTAHNYKHYGARGIVICARWRDFANFLADMGERPAGHTIDRIDPNGNYEPGNCRWASVVVQARNTRANKIDEASASIIRERRRAGEPLAAIANDYGVSVSTVSSIALGLIWKEAI